MKKTVLTIATSDSGGGAGTQADLKAIEAHGVFGASVIVALTAQNTRAVTDIFEVPLAFIEAQFDAVLDDIAIDAAKTGMLFSSPIIELVARKVAERDLRPFVVDPVMVSKSGATLLQDEAIATLREKLLPRATLVTPNAHEAAQLTGQDELRTEADAREAARAVHAMGAQAVLVKGGHLAGEDEAVDVLFDGAHVHTFAAPRLDTPHTHGTGCTYASAIAANLARGLALREAVARAKRYVTAAIRHGWPLGGGYGPTDHFYFLKETERFPIGEE